MVELETGLKLNHCSSRADFDVHDDEKRQLAQMTHPSHPLHLNQPNVYVANLHCHNMFVWSLDRVQITLEQPCA
jgi:hypothetical protein